MDNQQQPAAGSDDAAAGGPERPTAMREINYRHSSKFVPLLEHLGCSLLISTYAAGKVVSVGACDGQLHLGFSNFQQAMGIAPPRQASDAVGVKTSSIAVGGPNVIWFLRDGGSLARQVDPAGTYDRAYLARESFVTGNIHVHEMQWGADGQLWIVNTLFSCLSTLHEDFNFVPRWQPPFITELAPQDRCHLNGLAMDEGRPKYVSALGTSDAARGWRENKSDGGVLIDVPSGQVVAGGFCMPHSPRLHDGKVFMLDSGRGKLVTIDPHRGQADEVASYPGYGRGLAFHGRYAFVGMSRARETSVFGGVPICQDRDSMRCGIVVIDWMSGQSLAFLEFESGVEELFDVQVMHGSKRTVVCGPYPREDQQLPVWVVPRGEQVDAILGGANGECVQRKRTC
ncbi:TIGR03032 family protein [Stieleria sp. ICT_E10.1]|uniref:TIGR03032 family protein n=1 Tax=Stieleria sedimenti TaxID=2976331 RepID=UPI00217F7C56|nr:TIGR03032 family protein [Stieleria sedimenti]MCS7468792.1 TIGR03032 family protein [Stieleria sedimenti]